MKALELTGKVNEDGELLLDKPLEINNLEQVKVILLIPDENDSHPDDNSNEEIKVSLKRALKEAKEGKTRPISELWERISD